MKVISSLCAVAAAAVLALCPTTPARAQPAPTVLQSATSPDGLLTLVLSATNASDTAGVNNTYTWTAINNSTVALNGVILGSHWGDWCGGLVTCMPSGPTLISAPGCAGQGADEVPQDAHFGVWCTPVSGVTLAPGGSVSGSVTLRPGSGGPPDYTVYSAFADVVTGRPANVPNVVVTRRAVVAPAPTDIQLTGHASNGSPPAGSTFTYTYQVKNAGPWGTFGDIIFADTLPASLTFVSSAVDVAGLPANFCSLVGQTIVCRLIDLQNGGPFGQVTITLTVAASGVPQAIENTATVHVVSPQEDSNLANNSVTVNVTTK